MANQNFVYDEADFRNSAAKTGNFLKKFGGFIVAAIIALIIIFDSTYQVNEQEQAVLVTLGKPQSVTDSGLHFKIPIIQRVIKVDTTIHGFGIGYDVATNITNSNESLMITSDYNFVNVDFFVEYKVIDPVKAVYASRDPEMILKNIAQSSIRTVVASYDVDSVLTTGKTEIQAAIKQLVVSKLDAQDLGIALVNMTIQDSEPPTAAVMEAFKAVETAKQGKETALNNANKYKNEKLPEAEANADGVIKIAEAAKEKRIYEATAHVAIFNAMYEEFVKNPRVTKLRMFYETMEDVLPDLKVIIVGTDGVETVLPLDSFMDQSTSSAE
ncbi:MAG: FtsH protease activity modulator HflK [Clostridiales bacterium]|nr:FtsH protease activity modulator HflK [Candidatus Crickella merdequi]